MRKTFLARRSKPEPPPPTTVERIAEIRDLLAAYRAAPGRQITRAAIMEVLIARLPWLMAEMERLEKLEQARVDATGPGRR